VSFIFPSFQRSEHQALITSPGCYVPETARETAST
jgi:hypothetical protein